MESANHEFTWLSGRAHLSVAREAQRGDSPREKNSTTESSIAKTRLNSSSSLNVKANSFSKPEEKPASSKPTPLPRIFRRAASTEQTKPSTPIYEVPPTLDKSVFYVATPQAKFLNDVKPTEVIPSTLSAPSLRSNKSIILEFDPILQLREEEALNNKRLSNLRLSTLNISTSASETPTLPLIKESHNGVHLYQELEPITSENQLEPVQKHEFKAKDDCSVSNNYSETLENTKRSTVVRTSSNTSSNASFSSSRMSSSPCSSPSTSLRNQSCDGEEQSSPDSNIVISIEVPKVSISKSVPTPKPRSKINSNNVNIGNKINSLSSVVPAPPPEAYKEPTHLSWEKNNAQNSLAVDNNLYMLCEGNSLQENVKLDGSNVSSYEESDSSSVDGSGYDPPPFPPPPPPPSDYSEVITNVDTSKLQNIDHSQSIRLPPRTAPPKPPRFKSVVGPGGSLDRLNANQLVKENSSTAHESAEPKYKYHFYHNVLDMWGETGIYGKINKTNVSNTKASTTERPHQPPPLPPRGQQQRPPGFKLLTDELIAKRNSTFLDSLVRPKNDYPILYDRDSKIFDGCNSMQHHGMLYRIGKGKKDINQRWVVLERGHLQCFLDDKSDSPQEIFHKSDIVSVAKGVDVRYSNFDLKCFEVTAITNRERPQVFGARYLSEREVWMKHLVQSLSPLPNNTVNTSGVVKAGYVFLRKSVTGSFQIFWLLLHGRQLDIINDEDSNNFFSIDLRKVISMQEFEQDPQMSALSDEGPVFVIHYPSLTIYIRSTVAFDTLNWYQRIFNITKETGLGLEDQQLTHEDVPVIVDKCIKFISTYGLTSKGIYRESATNSKITKLLDSFYKDAQKTDLKIEDHSEHEVANVLKRFLRSLPEPLLVKNLYPKWMSAVEKDFSLETYRCLLDQLPRINYQTLKKLLAHLRSVDEHREHNLMPTANLAQMFGPTLLSVEKDMVNSNHEFEILINLIDNYCNLFAISNEEIEKEEIIQRALKDLRDAKKAQKPAGDILVGIYIYNRQNKCLNVKLSPTMTAYDLCKHATQQIRMRERPENLAIFEIVCNGDLERPLHHTEIVLEVTLRWSTWAEADAKDNYLVIKPNDILLRIMPFTRQPLSTFGELKYAPVKSKSFKKLLFEFKNARLAYYKDAKITQPIEMWNIEDITWYIGADSKRAAPWCITFIEQKAIVKRGSKEAPFFGNTICFSGEDEFNKWVASMFIGQYPKGILPKIEYFDLLT